MSLITRPPLIFLDEPTTGLDPAKREAHYTAAIKRATEQAYWLPLCTSVTQYAYAKNLVFKPFRDELPRFYLSSWK